MTMGKTTKPACLFLLAAAAILISLAAPRAAVAELQTLFVEHNPTASGHFATIQQALVTAQNNINNPLNKDSFRIIVQADPVPYTGPVTLIDNVPIIGSNTAGTFLAGRGSGTFFTGNGVTNVAISNFTFLTSSVGISLTNSSDIHITNNVFVLGSTGTAIQVQNGNADTSSEITNNTFYNNGTAISTNSDITISNDIFSTNNTAIATQISLTKLSYSDFFNNTNNGVTNLGAFSIPNQVVLNPDPQFVNPGARDFHLESGSPAKGSGNPQLLNSFDHSTSDMGAYGGPDADTTIATVTGVSSTLSSPTAISVDWNATGDSSVNVYRVYYGTASGNLHGTQASEGPSPIEVPVSTTHATLSGITLPAPAAPAAPAVTSIVPLDEALQVSWTSVTGATGYRIYYSTTSFTGASLPASPVNVGAGTTTTKLTGLQNGTEYFVAVAALAQAQVFIAVTAVQDAGIASDPGGTNESPLSQETSQAVGAEKVSPLSNVVHEFPEAISPYPNLKNGGCFIATAAYGFYSAPQVQALRRFRDCYLMTNAPGRAFVAWYYRHGPAAAGYLNAHPWLKAPVRLALLPLVALALFLFYTSFLTKILLLAVAAFGVAGVLHRATQRKLHLRGQS